MIAVGEKDFWGLADSILEEGYTGEGNLIVLREGDNPEKLVVKEGNRRLAAIKLVRELLSLDDDVDIPVATKRRMARLTASERADKKDIPVLIYPAEEADIVDRIVARKHGKGGYAGRAEWNSVPRARHNRAQGANEYGLDLLEKYLEKGKNLTPQEQALWEGDYPVTILDEALSRTVAFLDRAVSVKELVAAYPRTPHRVALESMMAAIGRHRLKFPDMRKKGDEKWSPEPYGFVRPASEVDTPDTSDAPKPAEPATGDSAGGASNADTGNDGGVDSGGTKPDAFNTYKDLQAWFKALKVNGDHREKVAILAKEATKINVDSAPHAVAFLVRSMFELSAKAYCKEHAGEKGVPTYGDANGRLEKALLAIIAHIRNVEGDQALLYGAELELKHDEKDPHFLSTKSMNQLVHNPQFLIDGTRFLRSFANLKYLLEALNK